MDILTLFHATQKQQRELMQFIDDSIDTVRMHEIIDQKYSKKINLSLLEHKDNLFEMRALLKKQMEESKKFLDDDINNYYVAFKKNLDNNHVELWGNY